MKSVSLTSGELHYPPSPLTLKAGAAAVDEELTRYPATEGIFELRAAIARHYQTHQAEIMPGNVLITSGARHGIYNVLRSNLRAGRAQADEVIVPTPYWFAFPDLIRQAGGRLVPLPTHLADGFAIDPARLEALITDRTRLLVLTNPCNPSGKIYSVAEIDALVAVLERHPHVHVLADEVYEFISFEGGERRLQPDGTWLASVPHISSWQQVADRVVTVSGFSKGFAMAGWRVGYVVAAENLIQRYKSYQDLTHSGVSALTQRAALAAWNDRGPYLTQMMEELHQRRALATSLLGEVEELRFMAAQGTYYLFPDVSAFFGRRDADGNVLRDATDFTKYLFADARVQVLCGTLFGDDRHVRLSFGVPTQVLREGLQRMARSLRKLSKASRPAAWPTDERPLPTPPTTHER